MTPTFYNYSSMLVLDLDIQWDIKNNYKQVVYGKRISLRSDPFKFEIDPKTMTMEGVQFLRNKDTVNIYMAVMNAMKNNLAYSFMQIREEMTQKGLLKRTDTKESNDEISIKKTTPTSSEKIGAFLDAAVSVKVDNGHGSGFCISEDGYILTNYHVIANTKKIEVVFNDGSSEIASIVRTSLIGDVALLKVNKKDLKTVHVTSLDLPEAGTEVWTIGTPKSIELGQSVTKGIVSSFKKGADLEYIQTDVNISPGNSGGALLTNKGSLLGMISMKIIDEATAGIGFAISTADILRLLNIEIKP
jgi:S1-C subfamily serine protease